MTADRTPLERLRDLLNSNGPRKGGTPTPKAVIVYRLWPLLLDRAGLCKTCGGVGELRWETLGSQRLQHTEPCECVTRLNEAIEREVGK